MGKNLIIKGADFSANALNEIYIPQAVINATGSTFFTAYTWDLVDDVNELSGKTITGFDLLFENKCSGQTMGINIVFNPGTEQAITCNIVCNFETQDESEQKIIHYDLSEPHTFNENDVLRISITNATYVDSSGNSRGGCKVFRVNRPDNIPNFAFLSSQFPNLSFQPFKKLYL